MTSSLHRCFFLAMIFALLGIFSGSQAQVTQWNDQTANTPSLIQTNFGPYGDMLPGDGEAYCGPTAMTMALFYAGSNGFTQLAPSSYDSNSASDQLSALNLELVIAGLAGSSPNTGTQGSNLITGIDTYFAAEGISTSQYTMSGLNISNGDQPALNYIAQNLAANRMSDPTSITLSYFTVGWYYQSGSGTSTWLNDGGHFLAPTAADLSNGTLTLHNPWPLSFNNVQNIPANSVMTVGVTQIPSGISIQYLTGAGTGNGTGTLTSQDYSQIQTPYDASDPSKSGTYHGDNSTSEAVIDGAAAWSISTSALPTSTGYTINPWEIDSSQLINTNGAVFKVIAPLLGTSGFDKQGQGQLVLTNTNSLSGTNVIESGTLVSTVNSGTPFGTGAIILGGGGAVEVRPDDTTPSDVNLQVASGAVSSFQYDVGGGTLALTKGANTSLTVTLGGNTDSTTPNIRRQNLATLVVAPDAGINSLGNSIKVLVAGTDKNVLQNTNGIVTPSIVGQDTDANQSGTFLHYSTTNGLVKASEVFSSSTGINDSSVTGTTVYDAVDTQSVTAGNTVSIYALQLDGGSVTQTGPGAGLTVGDGSSFGVAGIIFNGGSISTDSLNFGASEGAMYASMANGSISSQINGTGGLTKFGPGSLTITSNNASSLSGSVTVNGGTLVAANTSGSATGSGPVKVYGNATLQVNSGASVSGDVYVGNSGNIYLDGGTITGKLTTAPTGTTTAQPGGTLMGHGIVAGADSVIGANIVAGPEKAGILEFQQKVDLSNSSFFWQPTALVDNSTVGSGMGIGWNGLKFDLKDNFSSSGMSVYLDFSLIENDAPNSNDIFWTTNHDWEIMSFPADTPSDVSVGNADFAYGYFQVSDNKEHTELELEYIYDPTPVPEPQTYVLVAAGVLALVTWQRRFVESKNNLSRSRNLVRD